MAQIIQLRRGTAAEWTAANPVLAEGEVGVEMDTGFQKVGNGTANWAGLPYSQARGDDGSNFWTTGTQLTTGTTNGVNPVAVAGRQVKVGDLVVSSHTSSPGHYGRVTAVASQTSVTVQYLGSLRGAVGPASTVPGPPGSGGARADTYHWNSANNLLDWRDSGGNYSEHYYTTGPQVRMNVGDLVVVHFDLVGGWNPQPGAYFFMEPAMYIEGYPGGNPSGWWWSGNGWELWQDDEINRANEWHPVYAHAVWSGYWSHAAYPAGLFRAGAFIAGHDCRIRAKVYILYVEIWRGTTIVNPTAAGAAAPVRLDENGMPPHEGRSERAQKLIASAKPVTASKTPPARRKR